MDREVGGHSGQRYRAECRCLFGLFLIVVVASFVDYNKLGEGKGDRAEREMDKSVKYS